MPKPEDQTNQALLNILDSLEGSEESQVQPNEIVEQALTSAETGGRVEAIGGIEAFARGTPEGVVGKLATTKLRHAGVKAANRLSDLENILKGGQSIGDNEQGIADEDIRQEAARTQDPYYMFTLGKGVGTAAGVIGTGALMAERGLATMAAKTMPSLAASAVPRFAGQMAGRLAVGTGAGVLQQAADGGMQSMSELHQSIKDNGFNQLLIEGALSVGKGLYQAGRGIAAASAPTLRRARASGIAAKDIQEAAAEPIQLGSKKSVEQAQQTIDPFSRDTELVGTELEAIRAGARRQLGDVGERAKTSLTNTKQQMSKKYGEMTADIAKRYGNQAIPSATLFEHIKDTLEQRGALEILPGGSRLNKKLAAKALGPIGNTYVELFEKMGGLQYLNGVSPTIKDLTFNALRAERMNANKYTNFGGLLQGADTAAAGSLWRKIGDTMEEQFDDLKVANRFYGEGMEALTKAERTLRNSDLRTNTFIDLQDSKNVTALDGIREVALFAEKHGLRSDLPGLLDESIKATRPVVLANRIARNVDAGTVENVFLNLGQKEKQAIALLAKDNPKLLEVARRAEAAGIARTLWADAAKDATLFPVNITPLARGQAPRITLPDKWVTKIALQFENPKSQSARFAARLFRIPGEILSKQNTRLMVAQYLRSAQGQENLWRSFENPDWMPESDKANIPPQQLIPSLQFNKQF